MSLFSGLRDKIGGSAHDVMKYLDPLGYEVQERFTYRPREERAKAEKDRIEARAAMARAEAEAIQRAGVKNVLAQRALQRNSLFTGGGNSGGRSTLGV